MPQPTRNDLHQNVPLQNLTVAAMQSDEDFVLQAMAPFVEVDDQSALYYEYNTGAWNRSEMKLRGVGDESAGSGWTVSTSTYTCLKYSVHKDNEWDSDADEMVNPDNDAAEWLANQVRLKGEDMVAAELFAPSVWTTDLDGTSGSPSEGTTFKEWNSSSSTPQNDILYGHSRIKALTGKQGNVMIVGYDVHRDILTNAEVRDAIKYTDPTMVRIIESKLAAFFGVEKYIVSGAVYNSAVEGQTASLSFTLDSKAAWLGYVNPNPGKKQISAAYTFAWKGRKQNYSKGVLAKKFDIPEKEVTRHEVNFYADVKVISADCGVFYDAAVA